MTITLEAPGMMFDDSEPDNEISEAELRGYIADSLGFRRWLEREATKAPYTVGLPDNGEFCPLANWLYEVMGYREVEVRKERLYWSTGDISLPGWMRGFVHLIDNTYAKGSEILAVDALCVLAVAGCIESETGLVASMPELEPALAV